MRKFTNNLESSSYEAQSSSRIASYSEPEVFGTYIGEQSSRFVVDATRRKKGLCWQRVITGGSVKLYLVPRADNRFKIY